MNMKAAMRTQHTLFFRTDANFSSIDRVNYAFISIDFFLSDIFFEILFIIENTLCILNDPLRCHFHNKNFEEHVKRDAKRFETSILSDKFCSCVRQLLFDGITPFPYKVAKALDENIYRNVEFDSWNEARKAIKSKQVTIFLYVGSV